MLSFKSVFSGVALLASSAFAATDMGGKDEMGPAAFMWPADRVWAASMDNTAPCGSVASPGNRSQFPMENGKLSLIGQDESYDITLSISYLDNPKSNNDFKTVISAEQFKEIKIGHTCVDVPDAASSVKNGSSATFQLKYTSDWDNDKNETFYACADVVYVNLSDFSESIPCFNNTRESDDDDDKSDSDKDSSSSASASASPDDDKKSSSGLSGGAIAGIVVGSVAGAALLLGAGLFIYRRKAQRIAALRQQHSSRGVNWTEGAPKNSQSSNNSVRMNNL